MKNAKSENNWISWIGAPLCPVKDSQYVEVVLRNGKELKGRASSFSWDCDSGSECVYSYRITSKPLLRLVK